MKFSIINWDCADTRRVVKTAMLKQAVELLEKGETKKANDIIQAVNEIIRDKER